MRKYLLLLKLFVNYGEEQLKLFVITMENIVSATIVHNELLLTAHDTDCFIPKLWHIVDCNGVFRVRMQYSCTYLYLLSWCPVEGASRTKYIMYIKHEQ